MAERRTHRHYIDGTHGQIHVRIGQPDKVSARPLACLHMSPKSGRIFARFVEQASHDRIVIAHDYPGFGESDAPPAEPPVTVEDYAVSLWDVVDALGLGTIDLMGFHTGALVAADAARQRPEQVAGIVMISAPVFSDDELRALHEKYAPVPLDLEGTRFRRMWASVVEHRGPGMTLEMMAESFAENLRGGENYEWGHRAAFNYAPKFCEVVRSLPHRITVLNPNDDLVNETPRIATYLKNGEVIDQPDWGHGFFDARTDQAVRVITGALDA